MTSNAASSPSADASPAPEAPATADEVAESPDRSGDGAGHAAERPQNLSLVPPQGGPHPAESDDAPVDQHVVESDDAPADQHVVEQDPREGELADGHPTDDDATGSGRPTDVEQPADADDDHSPETDAEAAASEPTELGPDPAGLHARALEARDRLRPEGPVIPAPRSPQGVTAPPSFAAAEQPPADVVAAVDQLVADFAAVRGKPGEPVHVALARIGELIVAGIPDEGWSRTGSLEPEVVVEAAELADDLHAATTSVLERLDAAELSSPAAVVEGMATSLQVMRMVADLEVFARSCD